MPRTGAVLTLGCPDSLLCQVVLSVDGLERVGVGFVDEQGAVDDVRESAAQESERFGLGVAVLDPFGYVVAALGPGAGLGDGDPVQGGVDLAVAAAVEANAGAVARAGGLGCGAVPAGVGGLGAESMSAGGLADELGGGQRAAAGDAQERWGEGGDQLSDLALEFVDAAVELAQAVKLFACDRGDQSVDRREPIRDAGDDVLELEASGRDLQVGRDLMQMPADQALQAGSLGDQVVAMVDQQPHLARRPVELCDRQI